VGPADPIGKRRSSQLKRRTRLAGLLLADPIDREKKYSKLPPSRLPSCAWAIRQGVQAVHVFSPGPDRTEYPAPIDPSEKKDKRSLARAERQTCSVPWRVPRSRNPSASPARSPAHPWRLRGPAHSDREIGPERATPGDRASLVFALARRVSAPRRPRACIFCVSHQPLSALSYVCFALVCIEFFQIFV
jgi:hypothetical protein